MEESILKKKGIMTQAAMSEDWKTALAHKQRSLKEGEKVEILDITRNLYGEFYKVRADDGETFYINPHIIEIIDN